MIANCYKALHLVHVITRKQLEATNAPQMPIVY